MEKFKMYLVTLITLLGQASGSIFKTAKEAYTAWYNKTTQEYHENMAQYQRNFEQAQINARGSDLHAVLIDIFNRAQYHNIIHIGSEFDLRALDYKILDDSVCYRFSVDKISHAPFNTYAREKLIRDMTTDIHYYITDLINRGRYVSYASEHPIMYNGFEITNITDRPNEIIITVRT